jgi:hypothetical protein
MKRVFSSVCMITLLVGCISTQAGMKLESPKKEPTTLVGSFALKERTISVTDGDITCSGTADDMGFEWVQPPTLTFSNLSCSDGRTGAMTLNMNWAGTVFGPSNGIGIGKLSDGTKVKVIIGNLTASLNW